MFSLKIGNTWIILPAGTKVRIDLLSPLFESEVIPGSVVMDLDIPAEPNAAVFKNTHFIEVNRVYRKYDCTVYLGDQPFCKGKLIAKPKGSMFACGIALNSFAVDFAEKLVKNFDFGGAENIGGDPHSDTNVVYQANLANGGSNNKPYRFPQLYDADLYGDSNPDFGGDDGTGKKGPIANLTYDFGYFQVNSNHDDVTKANNIYTLIPMPFLHHVVKKVINGAGMQATGAFFNDPELKKALMVNYGTLDAKIEFYYKARNVFGMEVNISGPATEVLLPVIVSDTRGYNTAGKFTIKNSGLHKISVTGNARTNSVGVSLLPRFVFTIDVVGVLAGVKCNFNAFPFYEWKTAAFEFTASAADIGKVITLSVRFETDNGSYVWTAAPGIIKDVEMSVVNTSSGDINMFSNTIDLKNHVPPDMTAGTLLRTLRNGLGLAVWFDALNSEVQMDFLNDVLDSKEFIDLTDKAISGSSSSTPIETFHKKYTLKFDADNSPDEAEGYDFIGDFLTYALLPLPTTTGKLARVLNEGKFYVYKKDTVTDDAGVSSEVTKWWYYREDFAGVVMGTGDDAEDIDLGLQGISCLVYNDRLCLWSVNKGTSPAFATGKNTYGLQLAFWQGGIQDPNHDLYGCATPFNLSASGVSMGGQSISLHEPGDLVSVRLGRWYRYLASCEEVTQMFSLTIIDMFRIMVLFASQHGTNVRKVRMGAINYIPKRFSFNLELNKKEIETEAVLVKDGGIAL